MLQLGLLIQCSSSLEGNLPDSSEIPFTPSQGAEGVFCSWASCSNGHQWMPELAISKCPGCKSPIVAIKMVNCPICNEPAAQHGLRAEHVTTGGWIGKACQGQPSLGETSYMAIDRVEGSKYPVVVQEVLPF